MTFLNSFINKFSSLTKTKRKKQKMKQMSMKEIRNKHSKTLKKYKTRKSPPYPADLNCNKKMRGNDGNMYMSTQNKNDICTWKKYVRILH
jgi:hypothetical protein